MLEPEHETERNDPATETTPEGTPRSLATTIGRAALVALVLFGVMVGGIAGAAQCYGEQPDLELQYEGFD